MQVTSPTNLDLSRQRWFSDKLACAMLASSSGLREALRTIVQDWLSRATHLLSAEWCMECTRSLLPQTWTCHVNPDFPIEFESKVLIELTQISKPEVSALRELYARDSSLSVSYTHLTLPTILLV